MTRGLKGILLPILAIWMGMVQANDDFPTKPVTIVVPYPAGSIVDVRVRQIAEVAARMPGWKFTVDNRPGAMGTIGASYVAHAKPDGYTLLSGSSSELNLVPAYGTKLDFDPEKGLLPITQTVRGMMLLVAPTSLGVSTPQELVALARKRAEPLSYGNAGPGSITFVAGKLLEKRAGVAFLDVPYKSASQGLLDLIPGRLHFQFDFVQTSLPHIRDGKLKPLLVTATKRVPLLPSVPTAAEAGFPELTIPTVGGFFAPAGTPLGIIDKLHAVLARAVQSPEIEKAFAEAGGEAIGGTPQQFAAEMSDDRKRWKAIMKVAGIRTE